LRATQISTAPGEAGAEELLSWLEGVPAIRRAIRPTPNEIVERLGATSSSHALDYSTLAAIYADGKDMPTVRLKRELWVKLLRGALGTQFTDSDGLFLEHTLLVNSAEIIAHLVLGLRAQDLAPATLLCAWLDEQLVMANARGLIGLSSQADQHVAENRWPVEDYDVFDVWRHRSAVGQLGGHPGIAPQEPKAIEVDLDWHQVHVGFVVAHDLPNLRPADGGGLPDELGLRQRVVNFFGRWPPTNRRQGRQRSFHSGFGSRAQDFVVQLIAA